MMPASTDRELVAALGSSTFCRLCDSSTSGTTCGKVGASVRAAVRVGRRRRRRHRPESAGSVVRFVKQLARRSLGGLTVDRASSRSSSVLAVLLLGLL